MSDIAVLLLSSNVGRAHRRRLGLVAAALRERDAVVTESDLVDVTADPRENVFAHFTPDVIDRVVAAEIDLIDEVDPDVVVGDFRPTAALSARIRKKPFVSVINAVQSRTFDPTRVLMPSAEGFRQRIGAGLSNRLFRAQKRHIAQQFRAATDKYGLTRFATLDDVLAGDLSLLADVPDFVPLTGPPPHSQFVGPLVWQPDAVVDWLAERDHDRPLFYATTGHSGDPRIVNLIIDAFAGRSGADVIISVDDVVDPSDRELPSHVRVTNMVPGGTVLAQASGVVHAGGSGTMYQVMTHEVPAIVLPGTVDQRINATLVEARGLGLAMEVSDIDGEAIWAGFRQLSRTTWRNDALRSYGRLARSYDGPALAANAILDFVRSESLDRLDPSL